MRAAAVKLKRWKEDPVAFVMEAFHPAPDELDPWTVDALRAFPHRQRLAVQGCKGPGKSTLLAWLGWNFLLTRPHCKVPCTSISEDNLRDGLWAEFAKWQKRSPILQQQFRWSAERIVQVNNPETWWASARAWARSADAQKQADTLAGVHADYVLYLIDEVGGIPVAVVATAEAALASGVEMHLVMAGNPTQTDGPLYRACTRERQLWFIVQITGDPDSPKRSRRISKEWAREQIQKYGREHPWVLVNVFGEFPPSSSNVLIGLDVAEGASRRELAQAAWRTAARVVGVDVARFGDDRTVLFCRQGRVAFVPKEMRTQDTVQVSGAVGELIRKWRPHGVFIDETGVGGGVVDLLKNLGYPVVGVNAGSAPARNDPAFPRVADRRAEMWVHMAEWLKGACIPDDAELLSELTAPTYRFNAQGEIRLESKEDLKKRGHASPDKADGLALTFALPVAAETAGIAAPQVVRAASEFDPLAPPRREEGTVWGSPEPGRAAADFDPYDY